MRCTVIKKAVCSTPAPPYLDVPDVLRVIKGRSAAEPLELLYVDELLLAEGARVDDGRDRVAAAAENVVHLELGQLVVVRRAVGRGAGARVAIQASSLADRLESRRTRTKVTLTEPQKPIKNYLFKETKMKWEKKEEKRKTLDKTEIAV